MNEKINLLELLKKNGIGVIPGIGIKPANTFPKSFLEILMKNLSGKIGSINLHILAKNLKSSRGSNLCKYADIKDISGIKSISAKSISILLRKNNGIRIGSDENEKHNVLENIRCSISVDKNIVDAKSDKFGETYNITDNHEVVLKSSNVKVSAKSVKDIVEDGELRVQKGGIIDREGELFPHRKSVIIKSPENHGKLTDGINDLKTNEKADIIKMRGSDIVTTNNDKLKLDRGKRIETNTKVAVNIDPTLKQNPKSERQQEAGKFNNSSLKVSQSSDNDFKRHIKVKTDGLVDRKIKINNQKSVIANDKDNALGHNIVNTKEEIVEGKKQSVELGKHLDNRDFVIVNSAKERKTQKVSHSGVEPQKVNEPIEADESRKKNAVGDNKDLNERLNLTLKNQTGRISNLRVDYESDKKQDSTKIIDEDRQLSDFAGKDVKKELVTRNNNTKLDGRQVKNESSTDKSIAFEQKVTQAKGEINDRYQQVNIRNLLINRIIEVHNQMFGSSNRIFRTTIRVDAGEYGDMVFIGRKNEDNERIEILVQNENIKEQIRKILPDIQNRIYQKGFSVDNIDVEVFNNRKENRHSAGDHTNNNNFHSEKISDLSEKNDDRKEVKGFKDLGYNTMEILA